MRYTKKELLFDRCCWLYISVLVVLGSAGCDDSFQPLQQGEQSSFSIFGFLDASADTQWVRVVPARQQLDQPPVKPEMHVTLKHLESGHTVTMQDSLFLFSDGFHILNVWTTMDIEPEQSYRLRAELPNGATSQVTVTLPEDFPTPVLLTGERGISGDLLIQGVDRLVDVQSLWGIGRSGREPSTVPYRSVVRNTAPEGYDYTVFISVGRDLWYLFERVGRNAPSSTSGVRRQVFVASGGPEWNDEIPLMDDMVYNLPQSFSNVEGGVGYLVGIVSKTIPFKGCFNEQGENIACPEEKRMY